MLPTTLVAPPLTLIVPAELIEPWLRALDAATTAPEPTSSDPLPPKEPMVLDPPLKLVVPAEVIEAKLWPALMVRRALAPTPVKAAEEGTALVLSRTRAAPAPLGLTVIV